MKAPGTRSAAGPTTPIGSTADTSEKDAERAALQVNGKNDWMDGENIRKQSLNACDEAEKGDLETEHELVYPGGMKLAMIVVALCLSIFLVSLDMTIVATAIPKITDEFQGVNLVGW